MIAAKIYFIVFSLVFNCRKYSLGVMIENLMVTKKKLKSGFNIWNEIFYIDFFFLLKSLKDTLQNTS